MRGGCLGREDAFTVTVPVDEKGNFLATGTPTQKEYRLAFHLRELGRAERYFKLKLLAPGAVSVIIDRLFDGSLDNFLYALYIMLRRYHESVTEDEVYAIAEADFDTVEAAVNRVVGRALPEPADPKAPEPVPTKPARKSRLSKAS